MNRRNFILTALAATAAPGALLAAQFEVTRTPAQWQAMLTPAQYAVMRQESTERAGSSPLDKNYAAGTYYCRGCDLPLFPSSTKYDSGTGWPSFYAPFQNAIGTKIDNKGFSRRTEVHCRRCGSHLGHVFNDGPAPSGLRYCLNGVSLKFQAA